MSERRTLTSFLLANAPPWLLRTQGRKFLEAVGQAFDALDQRVVDGVRSRWPLAVDNSSLALLGRERRLRRGLYETDTTYARRLRVWLDRHRVRGGPYALLGQLHDYFLSFLPGRKDVVYWSGTRRWIDEDGAITRDSIEWEADGSDEWAQIWVVFYVPDLIALPGDLLMTLDHEILTTLDGDSLATSESISPGDLTPAEAEIFTGIVREWSAAHVKRIHVVLIWDDRRLWSYPQPVPQWGDIETTWGEQGARVVVINEGL